MAPCPSKFPQLNYSSANAGRRSSDTAVAAATNARTIALATEVQCTCTAVIQIQNFSASTDDGSQSCLLLWNERLRPLHSGCPTAAPTRVYFRTPAREALFFSPSSEPLAPTPAKLDPAGAGNASIYYQGAPACAHVHAQQRRKQLQKIRQRARVRLCVCARESWAMAAEGPNKAEAEAAKEVGEEKADVPAPGPPADDSKALVVADSK